MIQAATRCWFTTMVIAMAFGFGIVHGGEVTVVGSVWTGQSCEMCPVPVVPLNNGDVAAMATVEKGPIDGMMPEYSTGEEPGMAYESNTASMDELFPNGYFWEGMSCRKWVVDYRCRVFAASDTSCEYGTAEPAPIGWSPRSRREFPLNSLWHGVRVGIEDPTWGAQFEWMMPQQGIQGQYADYGWNPPNPDGTSTDLWYATQRWGGNFGMMVDFSMVYQMSQRTFNLPIEIWPIAGFRWQRFQIKCFDPYVVKEQNQWVYDPVVVPVEIKEFNQQYYTGYIGGQFRTRIRKAFITFQADWGYSWANNTDHHLADEYMIYDWDYTQGNSWHIGVSAEVPLSEYISVGFQYDHLAIATFGSHHHFNPSGSEDQTWNHGVQVGANQNWITGFLRVRF